MGGPFALVAPSSRGLSLALTRQLLRSTSLPVYATYRSHLPAGGTQAVSESDIHKRILETLPNVDPGRLNLVELDLSSESSIASAAHTLRKLVPEGSYLQTGFFTGGVLFPERKPADIDFEKLKETFQINVLSHLLLIKHFSCFLPDSANQIDDGQKKGEQQLSKWVHISARVGSISDNHKGGWFSYRSSKAALNQVIRTFDNHLKLHRSPSICVGLHPGTVKTDLSKEFWSSVPEGQLFEPEAAAEKLVRVVESLTDEQRGKVWDYAGKRVPW